MKNKEGSVSLTGVNRSASTNAKAIALTMNGVSFQNAQAQFTFTHGDEAGSDDNDAQPTRFGMNTSFTAFSSAGQSSFCIRPKSFFSIKVGAPGQAVSVGALPSQQHWY
jgi:hypothetical protein